MCTSARPAWQKPITEKMFALGRFALRPITVCDHVCLNECSEMSLS
jgi:hypothetical protein